ncbi:Succinate dehydrogenase hydrophobic membrane anchor subunit [Serratia plymuthica]|uniref:Succinate dehydrogenase hydrophobic membrane anchor subunit n=1 Tax=Serratia plymuthica TaxID=82996 RepID=A0A2X4UEH3_SERPL|nr:Succinate dehydrogenase hydrophobic membrane anchor subunit [Serratia plymuthica]
MVNNVSALGRNGVHDWLLLRASAIVITLYVLYILASSSRLRISPMKSGAASSPPLLRKCSRC